MRRSELCEPSGFLLWFRGGYTTRLKWHTSICLGLSDTALVSPFLFDLFVCAHANSWLALWKSSSRSQQAESLWLLSSAILIVTKAYRTDSCSPGWICWIASLEPRCSPQSWKEVGCSPYWACPISIHHPCHKDATMMPQCQNRQNVK